MDKLKTLLMKHGEKIVAVICALFGFLALTSASWDADDRSPVTIEQLVAEAKNKIETNPWPEEDQKAFDEIPDVLEITSDKNKLLTQASDFPLHPFRPSTNRLKEKRTQPIILPALEPVATAIIVPIAKPPSEEEAAEDTEVAEAEAKDDKKEKLSDEEAAEKLLAERFGLAPTGGVAGPGGLAGEGSGGGYAGSPGGGYGPGGPGSLSDGPGLSGAGSPSGGYAEGSGGYGAGGGYGASGGYGESGGYGDLYGQYGSALTSKKKDVQVSAGVSVRMIVDLQKQRNLMREALHLTGDYTVAQKYIQYIDLQVERRQKQEGKNPWSAEWEPVSSEDLGEILKESFGVDRDIVSPKVTRNTITMPLPRRAAGTWRTDEASHPRLENFVLTAEEKELIDKYNQKVKERLEKDEKNRPVDVAPKGFSGFSKSAVDMQATMGGYGGYGEGSGSAGDDPYGGYDQLGSDKLTDEQKQLLDETRATADLRLLLVRFMDFTVERGYSYQYRVRLVMKNPNYRHPLDELEDPAIGNEPTLVSDWSVASPEVYVPVAHRLYLTEVDARPGSRERVDVTVYTDTTETGMPVMSDVRVAMGLPISGHRNVEVIDLRKEVLEELDIVIGTNDLLSSAEAFGRMSTSDHPDLKAMLDRVPRGVEPISDEICVVDGTGDIQLRSVGDKSASEKSDRDEFAGIMKIYEVWKPQPQTAGSSLFGTGSEGEGGYGEGSGGYGLGMQGGSASGGGYYGGGSSGGPGGSAGPGMPGSPSSSGRGGSGRSGRGR